MRFSTLALLATSAAALPAKRDVLPTIVFTPGAWHGTWAFDMVRGNLSLLGYDTEAVALPSVGSTNASVGLADDAAALKTVLTELADAGKDIVMVTHSYGGTVGSTAVEGLGYKTRQAEGLDGGVIMLVYMTAFAAPANTSLLDALGGEYLWWMEAEVSYQ
jgi:pimeloyl-ACP methyl ester carboxylesterase